MPEKSGMSERDYEYKLREIVFDFLSAPAVILISMAVIGNILDNLFHTTNSLGFLFSIIGGVPSIGTYYYKLWKKFINKSYEDALKVLKTRYAKGEIDEKEYLRMKENIEKE
ncbi:MAG: SHOCT domain-containing protein [Candidatus Aenigmatarchaeota archaeon]